MNAKQILQKKPITELEGSDDPLAGAPSPERPPMRLSGRMRRVPYHPPGMGGEGEEGMPADIARMVGREREPRGQFPPKEMSMLKDVMILILANLARSDIDRTIGEALMKGQPLDPGQLHHILDEARNVQNLNPEHEALLQRIFQQLQTQA